MCLFHPRVHALFAAILLVVGAAGCDLLFSPEDNDENADNDFFQPGSSRDGAAEIDLDTEYRANLESAGDEHWSLIETDDDDIWDRLEVRITNAGDGLRARGDLRDGDNRTLGTWNSANRGASVSASAPTQGGRHYLRITEFHTTGAAGPYTVEVRTLDLVDEYEPNDTRTDAYDLGDVKPEGHEDGISGIEATIVYSVYSDSDGYYGDLDWYKFTATDDSDIRVRISQVDEALPIGIWVYDQAGTRLGSVEAENAGQTGYLDLENPTPGVTYSVGLYGARPFGSTVGTRGSYTMNIFHLE